MKNYDYIGRPIALLTLEAKLINNPNKEESTQQA